MSDPEQYVDTIVVGAGHAGLALSRCLQRAGCAHVVLERDGVGASWRRRWDSFHLNTPNEINALPDGDAPGERGGFLSRDAWVETLEGYQRTHELPVRSGVEVKSIRRVEPGYEVVTNEGTIRSRCVVLCTGDQNVPHTPTLASGLPDDIEQLHSDAYRSPSQLPEGGVLVVGSGQSGAQIVEDLLDADRPVWVCTSKVSRAPRRYRGRDITEWAALIGLAEQRPDDVTAEERQAPQGMISGTRGGHSVSLHLLAARGAQLLGRLHAVEGHRLGIGDELVENVAHGDAGVAKLRAGLDMFVGKAGLDAPVAEPDPADEPHPGIEEMGTVRHLDLQEAGIRSVIWATGYGGDFSYLPAELLDERGRPRHEGGVCAPGLYCSGLMWLRTRISGLVAGGVRDAEVVAERVLEGREEP